jgi:D-glycero-alpha-D-manno-heptose-7-phosphate kinase
VPRQCQSERSGMIIASTPLRISLFGGSTDTPAFIEKYGRGAVISFASSLKTYVTISQDRFGSNSKFREFIINYSRREEIESVNGIQNEIVRSVLSRFDVNPITVSLTSDVFSHGSGLASSSSYIISLIKAVSTFTNKVLTDSEICSLAYQIELELNPYCGLQDPYGCGLGGFKLLEFNKGRRVTVEFLPTRFFEEYDCHLIFTGVTRESKSVLKDVSKSVDKAVPLLDLVHLAYDALMDEKYETVLGYLNESWLEKKKTSDLITASPEIRRLDAELAGDTKVLAHKLLGAGNGGFFLCFTEKEGGVLDNHRGNVKIGISAEGVGGYRL